eukprot:803162-Rhodomonas_salina.2
MKTVLKLRFLALESGAWHQKMGPRWDQDGRLLLVLGAVGFICLVAQLLCPDRPHPQHLPPADELASMSVWMRVWMSVWMSARMSVSARAQHTEEETKKKKE